MKALDEKKENITADDLRAIIGPHYDRTNVQLIWEEEFGNAITTQMENYSSNLDRCTRK